MQSISKKLLLRTILVYTIFIIAIYLIIFIVIKPFGSESIDDISKKNFYEKFVQKEKELRTFLNIYEQSLLTLGTSKIFYEYILNQDNKNKLEELFLHNKKSLPDIFQIRYLDKNGLERVRIDGDAISIFNDSAKSTILKDNQLQDKSNKEYFKRFIKLEPMKVAYSTIDLNRDFGKITIPKMITIRLGMAIYGDNREAQGVLIYNISLNNIFHNFTDSSIYNLAIFNSKGKFISHYIDSIGLLGENSNYSLKDEIPFFYKEVLNNNEYKNNLFFSSILFKLNNNDYIKLMIKPKYLKKNSIIRFLKDNISLIFVVLSLIAFQLVLYVIFLKKENNQMQEGK